MMRVGVYCSALFRKSHATCRAAVLSASRRFLSSEAEALKLRIERAAALSAAKNKGGTSAGASASKTVNVGEDGGGMSGKAIGFLAAISGLFGLGIYTSHEVKNNPNGSWAQKYKGSNAEVAVNWIDQRFFAGFRLLSLPYSDQVIPAWESSPYYGEIPEGMPPPPLLVLDLNKTLMSPVHDPKYGWRFVKRPGLNKFLESLSAQGYYEIVIFSDTIVDPDVRTAIDPRGAYFWCGPDAGEIRDSVVLKRLDVMGRPLSRIVVIDDNEESSALCVRNTLLIKPFSDVYDKSDNALGELAILLQALVHENVPDFPACFDALGTRVASEAVTEYKMRLSEHRAQEMAKRTKGLGGLLRGKDSETSLIINDPLAEQSSMSLSRIVEGASDDDAEPKLRLPSLTGTGTTPTKADIAGVGAGALTGVGSGSASDNNLKPKTKKAGPWAQWYSDSQKAKQEVEMKKQQYMNETYGRLMKEKQEEEDRKKKRSEQQ